MYPPDDFRLFGVDILSCNRLAKQSKSINSEPPIVLNCGWEIYVAHSGHSHSKGGNVAKKFSLWRPSILIETVSETEANQI